MHADDRSAKYETEARPGRLGRDPGLEQPRQNLRRKPGTVVFHFELPTLFVGTYAEEDHPGQTIRERFAGVVAQVGDQTFDEQRLARDLEVGRRNVDVDPHGRTLDVAFDRVDHVGNARRLALDRFTSDEAQDAFDDVLRTVQFRFGRIEVFDEALAFVQAAFGQVDRRRRRREQVA